MRIAILRWLRERTPPEGGTSANRIARPERASWIWPALTIAATLAVYLWVGQSSGGGWPRLRPPGDHETDHFNLLSHGFMQGHLYADLAVPPEILRAPNPYDPALSQVTPVLHDASYYRGHYYLYFGPAPVVTLFVPFALLTGRDLPLPVAVWIFSIAGYVALVGIFFFVQRRHFPAASASALVAALVALGSGSMLLTLLRRSHIWELSLAAGFFFFTVSLYCLMRAFYSRRATAWAAAGGLALGLAIASRPTYLLCCALFVLPLLLRKKNAATAAHYRWSALLAAGAICAAIGVVLAGYNYARFGNPLEFGITYQLSGTGELTNRHFSLSYFGFNFQMYFLSALRWVATFPFLTGPVLSSRPAGQAGVEYTFGLFRNLPFAWFGFAALAGLLGWRARRDDHEQPWPVVGLIALSAALNSVVPLFFFGSCVRYMVDFAPSFMLLAAFGLLAWEARLRSPLALRLLRGTGLILAAGTALVAVLTIVNFYDNTANSPPAAFRPLARMLDRPFFQLRARHWPGYAPTEIVFALPADCSPRQEPLFDVTQDGGETALVFIDYVTDRSIRLGYRERGDDRTTRFSPAVVPEPGSVHTLRLSVGGTYAEFDGAKARLRAQLDGHRLWNEPVVSIDVFPGAVSLGENPAATGAARRFTGEIRAHRTIAVSDIGGAPPEGVRVRFTLQPEMAGHALPILVSGRSGEGDMLFLRVRENAIIAFGYDHWGASELKSPEIPLHFGEPLVLECWIPSNPAPGSEPLLVVRVNGATVWRRPAPFHPAAPESVTVGLNLIGGSTCEAAFPNAVFEYLAGPPPP